MGNGTTFLNISSKDIHNISMPIPPLVEQVRIVNRIESLFDKVNKAREGFEKRKGCHFLEKTFSDELTRKWREENGVSYERESYKLKEVAEFKSIYDFKRTQFS